MLHNFGMCILWTFLVKNTKSEKNKSQDSNNLSIIGGIKLNNTGVNPSFFFHNFSLQPVATSTEQTLDVDQDQKETLNP